MRKLGFHPSVTKDTKNLPAKHFKQIFEKVLSLLNTPIQNDTRKLSGSDNLYRVTSGEYRIIYSATDEEIFIEAIGARNDDEIYKKLERRF